MPHVVDVIPLVRLPIGPAVQAAPVLAVLLEPAFVVPAVRPLGCEGEGAGEGAGEERRTGDGGAVAGGRWQVAGGGWWVAGGRWQVAGGKWWVRMRIRGGKQAVGVEREARGRVPRP